MLDLLQVVQLLVVVDLVVGFPLGPGKELGGDLGELLLQRGVAAKSSAAISGNCFLRAA